MRVSLAMRGASGSSSVKLQLKAGARKLAGEMMGKVTDRWYSGPGTTRLDKQLNVGMRQLNGILKFLVLPLDAERIAEDEVWVQRSG